MNNENTITSPPSIGSKLMQVGEATAIKAIDNISQKFDIDLNNKESVSEKLTQLNELLKDPIIKKKILDILQLLADDALIILKVATPALLEFINSASQISLKAASNIGKNMVNVALNTAEAIPGPGTVIGIVRDLDQGAKAVSSAVGATAELSSAFTNAINKTVKQINDIKQGIPSTQIPMQMEPPMPMQIQDGMKGGYKQIKKNMQYRRNIMNKIGGSIKEFNDTTMNPQKILRNNINTKKYMQNRSSRYNKTRRTKLLL